MLNYSTVNKIIRLGREGYPIQAIARMVKVSEDLVENLLKIKLENYEEYRLSQNLLLSHKKSFNFIDEKLRKVLLKEIKRREKLKFLQACFDMCNEIFFHFHAMTSQGLEPESKDILKKGKELFDTHLDLPPIRTIRRECERILNEVRDKFQKGTKFRNRYKLFPVILYMVVKMKGISIKKSDIVKNTILDRKEFNDCFKQTIMKYPPYQARNKRSIVLTLIQRVRIHFDFPPEFITDSHHILKPFWPYLQYNSERVIAGIVCILTMIKRDMQIIPFSHVCKELRISFGNLCNRVKELFVKKFSISEFQSLTSSSNLIKKIILEKLKQNSKLTN